MNRPTLKHTVGNLENIQIRAVVDAPKASILGLDVRELPEIVSVSYRFLSKTYHGVGVINQNNGIEFVNCELPDSSITLSRPGITFLPLEKDKRSSRLCIFADLIDYLAYQTLQKKGFVKLPSGCDTIIMSDVRNFVHVSVEGDDYDMVYLYFPNDISGKTMTKTLMDRYGKHAVVCSPIYKGYSKLSQFVMAIEFTAYNQEKAL